MFYIKDPLLEPDSKLARLFWRFMGLLVAVVGILGLYGLYTRH
jgi:hypothetical protein